MCQLRLAPAGSTARVHGHEPWPPGVLSPNGHVNVHASGHRSLRRSPPVRPGRFRATGGARGRWPRSRSHPGRAVATERLARRPGRASSRARGLVPGRRGLEGGRPRKAAGGEHGPRGGEGEPRGGVHKVHLRLHAELLEAPQVGPPRQRRVPIGRPRPLLHHGHQGRDRVKELGLQGHGGHVDPEVPPAVRVVLHGEPPGRLPALEDPFHRHLPRRAVRVRDAISGDPPAVDEEVLAVVAGQRGDDEPARLHVRPGALPRRRAPGPHEGLPVVQVAAARMHPRALRQARSRGHGCRGELGLACGDEVLLPTVAG
mmetsp:Transcript_21773/g.73241  ORF Transcript_21773/g.73241 Transcript_21773/m.73241 type:complete len:315 (-) Transcript_21773:99-1043(-)